jgi:RimJ/RimL family protein N-acetyltransferase
MRISAGSSSRVRAFVAVENSSGIRIAERAGVRREGLLRAYWEHDGEMLDTIVLSLLPRKSTGARTSIHSELSI